METESDLINKIYVQLTFDTDRLVDACINGKIPLSKDANAPSVIDQSYVLAVASNGSLIKDNARKVINLRANVGNYIQFHGVSEYNNMDNPILIYAVDKSSGNDVLGDFVSRKLVLPVLEPGKDVLPPVITEMDFWYLGAIAVHKGRGIFNIKFALYQRDRKQEDPILYSFFCWQLKIVVRGIVK